MSRPQHWDAHSWTSHWNKQSLCESPLKGVCKFILCCLNNDETSNTELSHVLLRGLVFLYRASHLQYKHSYRAPIIHCAAQIQISKADLVCQCVWEWAYVSLWSVEGQWWWVEEYLCVHVCADRKSKHNSNFIYLFIYSGGGSPPKGRDVLVEGRGVGWSGWSECMYVGEWVWGQLGHLDCEEAGEIKGESVFVCVCVWERKQEVRIKREIKRRRQCQNEGSVRKNEGIKFWGQTEGGMLLIDFPQHLLTASNKMYWSY